MSNNTKNTMNWKKRLMVGAVALTTLAGAGYGVANAEGWRNNGQQGGYENVQRGGGKGSMNMLSGDRIDYILNYIDATEEQKTQIKAIFDNVKSEMDAKRENRDEMQTAMRDQMKELLTADPFDRKAVEDFIESRDAMRDEGRKSLETALLDAAAVLTPEQRTKLVDKFKDFGPRGGMEQGRGQGRGHGDGMGRGGHGFKMPW